MLMWMFPAVGIAHAGHKDVQSEEVHRLCVVHRGDVDDRMLTEAILPLLESLSDMEDVRPALHKRFGMPQ